MANNNIKQDAFTQGLELAAEDYYNEVKYLSDLSAFPIAAFKAGAEWADKEFRNKIKECVDSIFNGNKTYTKEELLKYIMCYTQGLMDGYDKKAMKGE